MTNKIYTPRKKPELCDKKAELRIPGQWIYASQECLNCNGRDTKCGSYIPEITIPTK